MQKYTGFVDSLPIKAGDVVTIPKGVRVRCHWFDRRFEVDIDIPEAAG